MNMIRTLILIMIALAAMTPVCARAMEVYCGQKVIREGLRAVEVAEACGSPDQVTTSYVERGASVGVARQGAVVGLSERELIPIERWFYRERANNLRRVFVFREGVLVDIATGP